MTPGIVRAFRFASTAARVLPPAVSMPIARSVGRIAGCLDRDRRRLVARNLQRVVGPELNGHQLRRSVGRVFASYADYYLQSFRLPSMTTEEIVAGFSEEGYERIAAGLEEGNGVIMAMPHLGSWEWAAHWLTLHHDVAVGCVVETLEPPELFDWYRGFRESLGMKVVGLGPSAGTETIAMLRENRVVCLPSDRYVGGAGVEVEFFGEVTMLPAGPATLALRTGAALLPIAIYDYPGGCHGVVRPPVVAKREGRLRDDVARVTRALAYELEVLIAAEPEQWHLLQPNWPSDRDGSEASRLAREPVG